MLLLLVTLLGAVIRIANILPYKFYPDAYQNLLVAQNIASHGSVVAALGEYGYLFPPFFMWSRPTYPILINISNFFINNYELAAQNVSFIAGVTAIPLTYYLIVTIFNSRKAAALTAILIAVSFNHVVWSGFIMTETTGVMFLLALLILLFKNINSNDPLNFIDIITGFIFSLAVFARYEYIILVIPILYIIGNSSPKPLTKIGSILVGFIITSITIFGMFFPVVDSVKIFWEQTKEFINLGFFAILISSVLYIFWKRIKKFKDAVTNNISKIFLLTIPLAFFYPGLTQFVKQDFLISILAFLGLLGMLKAKDKSLGIFILISTILMEIIYYNLNPTMIRYTLHTIPFLLIATGYLLKRIPIGNFANFILFMGVIVQMATSFDGIKNWNMGDWTRPTYEEVSARTLQKYINDDDVIVAAFPEPYYFFNHKTTMGIGFVPPYINLEGLEDNQNIVIVQDMAMRDIFPQFYNFTESNLTNNKMGQYFTRTNYRYKTDYTPEDIPVKVYRIKLWVLKDLILMQTHP